MARNCGNLGEKGRKQFLPEAWKIPIIMLAEGVNMATDAPPPPPPYPQTIPALCTVPDRGREAGNSVCQGKSRDDGVFTLRSKTRVRGPQS